MKMMAVAITFLLTIYFSFVLSPKDARDKVLGYVKKHILAVVIIVVSVFLATVALSTGSFKLF